MERKEKITEALKEAREIVKKTGIDGNCPEFPRYVEMVFNKLVSESDNWLNTLGSVLGRQFAQQPLLQAIPASVSGLFPQPSQEDITIVDEFMKTLEPEIMQDGGKILKEEIKGKLLRGGNPQRIKEHQSKGKKGKLKRRRGCVYLEFGEGTPSDPVDSLLILSA